MPGTTQSQYGKNLSVYISVSNRGPYHIDTTHIEELYMIEDIFSYCVSGKLVFNDRMALMEFGPLTGNETLFVEYGIEISAIKTFQIQKVNRVNPVSSNSEGKYNTIELFFVDTMFLNLMSKEFSRSWSKGTRYSDIVKHIANEMIEVKQWDQFEDSNEKIDNFCIPYWTPLQAINWLLRRCTGVEKGSPSYVFFNNFKETSDIWTNFVTLDKLIDNSVMDIGAGGKYRFQEENLTFANKILSYDLSGLDSLSKQELKGGVRRGYDFSRKKFLEKEFNYSGMIPKHKMLGKKSLFEDISDTRTSHEYLSIPDKSIIDNFYSNEWIKRYDMQQTMSITVTGHEKRYAGGVIEIEWKSADDKEEMNKNLSGYYLVKSITHYFVPGGKPPFQQKMVLIKNAYFESDNSNLLSTSKKRL